ncbi:UDP-N-acetylmuramyl-tripeptide synthetase [Candidatus Gottesmanbacteria bacterium]|nr:UDP-N-acetylmuramyl-tripeptide synthetase [Candidatus Gottesmanbacteria bacterium]
MLRSLKGLYHLLIAIAANVWFRFPSRKLTVVGITGTDGKTTTTTLIYEILKAAGFKTSMITSVHAVIAGKSYDTGFHVTTPTAWWVQKYLREAVNHRDTHFVLEVTSHALDQHRVFGVRFAVGVLTNVTHEHLDWHGTFQKYLKTKLTLLRRAKIAIINRDEEEPYNQAISFLQNKTYVTYGIHHEAKVTPETFPFTTKLPGDFNRYNVLAAVAATDALGIDQKIVGKVLRTFDGVAGRMEVLQEKPFGVIVDFAHTPNAITQVLKTVRPATKKRLIHVFGSAGLRDSSKRPIMGNASAEFADVIVLTEEDYRTEDVNKIIDSIASGVPPGKELYKYPNRADAIGFALKLAKLGDTVIITGKGHEKSLCRGTIEYPWSDQGCVKKILKNL